MNLSVGLITYNEENKLRRTLLSVKDIADEIVIVDNKSTDKTVEIAQSLGARVYVEDWKGSGLQKESVRVKCNGDWILLIDADEEISRPLQEVIRNIVTNDASHDVYKIRFRTICFEREIKYGGWSNFYRIRLFRKGAGKYDAKIAHENFITNKSTGKIKELIYHYTYRNIEEYFNKFNLYTTEVAAHYQKTGKRKSPLSLYFSIKLAFLKTYIFRLGFLDGFDGYFLAKTDALYTLVKYAKLRELNKKDQN